MHVVISTNLRVVEDSDGCEDLYLDIEAELQGSFLPDLESALHALCRHRDPRADLLDAFSRGIEAYMNGLELVLGEEDLENIRASDVQALYLENDHVKSFAQGYQDFRVDYPIPSFEGHLRNALLRGDWSKDFKSLKLQVKYAVLVDGNIG